MEHLSLLDIFASYKAWKADDATWFINFMDGSENMYLLEGSEKALLVDTGYGSGTLRAFVETLTDKPLLVANTHYHPDHAGGNGEWPGVYLHENWRADAAALSAGENQPFDLSQLPYPDYEKLPLKDGDKIELGGRTVEVLDCRAHSNSSLVFLDRGHRLLLCGDELEAGQVLLYDLSRAQDPGYDFKARLLAHRANMRRLKELAGEYDWVLPNHNGFPIAKSYVDDFIALADAIFDGTAQVEDALHHKYIEMDPVSKELCRVKYGLASFFVKKAQLMDIYGKGE